ncbi:MAG: glycosyltransferase [Solirubrobacterales bacterium]|nr:glycosyltransferase [Solirubrobacterales bacterium]
MTAPADPPAERGQATVQSGAVAPPPLHIAWIGFAPAEESGGVPGIATDLLHGLAALGHRIDCFFPSREHALPARITGIENVTYVWGTSTWKWDRWYSRGRLRAFLSSLAARSLASLRLREEVTRRHATDPYDVFYQFSNVENLSIPRGLKRSVPVVAHPGQSSADALRFLVRERRLSFQGRSAYAFALAVAVLWSRMRVQRRQIRRASLVICISEIFREHLIRDYGLREQASVVVPNPVRLDRFDSVDRGVGDPPTVIVLGRIATGKGVEDVVAVARLLLEQGVRARVRVVGGTSVWSDYTKVLDGLPAENSEYAGHVQSSEVPGELARSDVLLQASRYEAFALTVAEALAAGVPVIGTSEVGAMEQLSPAVATLTRPGDPEQMAAAVVAMLDRLAADPAGMRAAARAEAERLFAPEIVCAGVSSALARLTAGRSRAAGAGPDRDPGVQELTGSAS